MSASRRKTASVSASNKNSFLLAGMGNSFVAIVLAGFIVGYLFDSLFDSKPIFIIGCGIMGFVGGLLKLHKMLGVEDSSNSEDKLK